jgi:hypothetical protein
MTTRTRVPLAPENTGIHARPGVARTDPAPPPGEGRPSSEGVPPRGSRARETRAHDCTPLGPAFPAPAGPANLPDKCQDYVDLINQALVEGRPDDALVQAFQYLRARVKHVQGRRREADADGFRRYGVHLLAALAGQVHDHYPADDYRAAILLVPGGNWVPPVVAEGGGS